MYQEVIFPTTSSIAAEVKKLAGRYGRKGLMDAEDIAQEAMVKVLRKADGRPVTLGWLARVVRNLAIDAGRKASREQRESLVCDWVEGAWVCEDTTERYHPQMLDPTAYQVESKLDGLSIEKVLETMPERAKQVLLLYAEGFSYEEIARLTGAQIGTVRSRLHYARLRARDLLSEFS